MKPYLAQPVRDLIDLQLATGARPGELVGLKLTDLDRRGAVWTLKPAQHKNAHRAHERTIYFGPTAQAILERYLVAGADVSKPIFDPKAGNAERKQVEAKSSRRPNQKKNKPRGRKFIGRQIGDAYTVVSYARAIRRACDRANDEAVRQHLAAGGKLKTGERLVARWHPHRLRHTAATLIREQFGIEAARTLLGHATLSSTMVYAEQSDKLARSLAQKVG